MQVVLYVFDKRDNSTKRPADGLAVEGLLRNASGVTAPTFDFQIDNPIQYNYFYIPIFGRYYWLTEWTRSDGLWTASMQVDVLASWRDQIGASRQYVTRSSAESDGAVIDNYYPTKTSPVTLRTLTEIKNFSGITYVVGVVGEGSTSAVTYYTMTEEEFKNFSDVLMRGGYLDPLDFGNLTLDFVKTVFNPFQYIVSVMAFPFTDSFSTPVSVRFGWFDSGILAAPIRYRNTFSSRTEISVPKHPQGDYHNSNAFSKYSIFHPIFGEIVLDADIISDFDTITADIVADPVTGNGYLYIHAVKNYTEEIQIGFATAQIGQPVQISQLSAGNPLTAAGTVVGSVANALSKNYIGALQGIGSAASSMLPSLQLKGCNGNVASFKVRNFVLQAVFYLQTDTDPANHGKPLCKVRTISSIPGYIQCEKPDINAPATAGELESIKSYMEGGFFFE